MTDAPDTLERRTRTKKRGGLYVTDAELIEILGVPEKIAREALHSLDRDRRAGFPRKQPLWGNRRHLPSVEKWCENTGGLILERKSA